MKQPNLARASIQAMRAYAAPPGQRHSYDGLLLDFNERSLPPAPAVQTAVAVSTNLQRYPEYTRLPARLTRYVGVGTAEIMLTNGSDEAIDVVFRTFTEPGDTVIIPGPSFAMLYRSAELAGTKVIAPPYQDDDLAYPLDAVLRAVTPAVKLIVVCNPNNPTGTLLDVDAIARLAAAAPHAVILVDEAYFEFSGITAVPLIAAHPNLIVTRTFSKAFGLAALRIGYSVASATHIAEMLKIRSPFAVNLLAHNAASAALDALADTQAYARAVMTVSKPLLEAFFTEKRIPFYPSAANFILFRPPHPEAVCHTLEANGIRVRPQTQPPIEGTIRVSLTTPAETKRFIAAYKKLP